MQIFDNKCFSTDEFVSDFTSLILIIGLLLFRRRVVWKQSASLTIDINKKAKMKRASGDDFILNLESAEFFCEVDEDLCVV